MAKRAVTRKPGQIEQQIGTGGATHQIRARDGMHLTTNQGLALSDNQNSLTAGARGPTLLEDFVLREKITSFDHERIPKRILDATKLIPEELHPLRMVGRMVLKRPPPGGVAGQFRVSAGTPRPLPR